MAGPDKRPEANRRRLATTLRDQIAARRTIADQVVRAADVHLVNGPNGWELAGVEVGLRSFIRRLLPKARAWPPPDRAIDGADLQAFVPRFTDTALPGEPGPAAAAGTLVVNAQVLNGIITPLLLTYVVILANRSSALRAAKNGPIFKTVATVCVAVGSVLWFVVLVESLFGLG